MLITFFLCLWIGGLLILFYYNVNRILGLFIFALLGLPTVMLMPFGLKVTFGLLWLLFAVFLLVSKLRIHLATKFIMQWFRKQQSSLSSVERDVLESGGTWWEGEFFSGAPKWEKLFNLKLSTLTAEEKIFLDNDVNELCRLIDDYRLCFVDHNLSDKVWDYIKSHCFWGLIIPKQYGGLEFSALAHSAVITKVASHSPAVAISMMVPNSLGPAEFLIQYGTDQQRQYYLPRLACGEEIGCFALTSIDAGSDATAIKDTGVVCKRIFNNEMIVGIELNFAKRYITLAPMATLIGLAFKLYDPNHLLGEKEDIGITLGLVPQHLEGVSNDKRHRPLNDGFPNGPVEGRNVFIPLDYIIGGPEKRGQGWRMLMECLSIGRGISLPALMAGGAKIECRMSSAYAQIRQQFKRPIGDFEGIRLNLAKIAGYSYMIEAMRIFTVEAVNRGVRPAIASAITKYHTTELHRYAINHALDIHGGRGIQMGPRNYLVKYYLSAPVSITVEGANILTRNLIIYGQGVMRCHPFLSKAIMVAQKGEDKQQLKQFDTLFMQHIGFFISSFVRTLVSGWLGGRNCKISQKTSLKPYLRQLTRMSAAFALITDITLMMMGESLKLKESMTARLGDILSYLYMSSAVIKQYQSYDEHPDHRPLVIWSLQYCLSNIQKGFDNLLMNYPYPILGKILRVIIFPWGCAYVPPKDHLSFSVACNIQDNIELRDMLSQGSYIASDPLDPVGRIEKIFSRWQELKPLFNRVKKSTKKHKALKRADNMTDQVTIAVKLSILSQEEGKQLLTYLDDCLDALAVDEFNFNQGNCNERNSKSSIHVVND